LTAPKGFSLVLVTVLTDFSHENSQDVIVCARQTDSCFPLGYRYDADNNGVSALSSSGTHECFIFFCYKFQKVGTVWSATGLRYLAKKKKLFG
jgi:hypothetical protein